MSEMSMRQTLSSLFHEHPICLKSEDERYAGPILIGHRGVSRQFPENTLPAFGHALKLGAKMLELDVRLSKDNEVVVIHDPTVDRTAHLQQGNGRNVNGGNSNNYGNVNSFTLCELQAMGFPALKDVFLNFIEATISVEIKDQSWLLCEKVVALIKQFHRQDRTTIELIALGDKLAHRLRQLAPELHSGHTTNEIIRFVTLSKLHATKLFRKRGGLFEVPIKRGRIKIVSKAFVRAAHRKGIRVFVWTVNDPATISYLCGLCIDGIYTDDLPTARKTVEAFFATRKHLTKTK
jgi:glycerophosphoryl diester phosphodiesterase